MSAQGLETFLARVYTDAVLRGRFVAAPREACAGAGLTEREIAALEAIDRDGLELAALSFEHKRRRRAPAERT